MSQHEVDSLPLADEIPEWFTGPRAERLDDRMTRKCGVCGAPPGERCRYVSAGGAHLEPFGDRVRYVDNVIGAPTVRPHKGR
jgi:hypothetical protein